ncbi:hypothetical protein AAC387_Pa06g1166 [Persea americana]
MSPGQPLYATQFGRISLLWSTEIPPILFLLLLPGRSSISHPARTPHLTALNLSLTPSNLSNLGDLCWEHVGRVMNLFGTISCEAKACTHFVYYEKVICKNSHKHFSYP